MKVPIEVDGEPTPNMNENDEATYEAPAEEVEAEEAEADEAAADEAEAVEAEDVEAATIDPDDEEAMIEAAKRAGAAAAEEELRAAAEQEAKAQADRAREEAGDLLVKLAQIEDELEGAKKEAASATDRFLRLQADWENYRRRTAAERLAEKERAAEKLVVALLPVLDDMERASATAAEPAAENEQFAQFVAGVDAVHDKMVDILAKQGVSVIDPVGEAFDPLLHQAVGRVEDAEAYDETVAQVFQRGYAMGGKVIRNAMVTVTYGGPKRPAPEAQETEE